MTIRHRTRLFPLLALLVAAPAAAHPAPAARLISCGAGDCVLLRGHRDGAGNAVRINGHVVAARGGATWRVSLPVATVRDWSPPFARTLRIALVDPAGSAGREEEARLPVGLLGGEVELAALVVRAR